MARRRDFGSIRKLPSGRWQARYRNAKGEVLPAPETFGNKGDAIAWLAGVQTDSARGTFIDPRAGRISLENFAESFLAGRVLADRTVETYRGLLTIHILPELGKIEIGHLTPGDVRVWHNRLAGKYPSTAAKSYRLLRTMLNAAVADELIARSPCRIEGAGKEAAPERPIATIQEAEKLVAAMPERFQAIVVLAAWCQLRKGELLALRRRDVDLLHSTVKVARNLQQLRNGQLVIKEPKTTAGRRTVSIPSHVVPTIRSHLERFTALDPDALVFTGEQGGPLRPHVLQKHWSRARLTIGRPELHLRDLRHTGNTWAAATGASTRELMTRMGHSSAEAALRYQHATAERDKAIADALAALAEPAPVIKMEKKRSARPTTPDQSETSGRR